MKHIIFFALLLVANVCRAQVDSTDELACGGFNVNWNFRCDGICYRILSDTESPSVEVCMEKEDGHLDQQANYQNLDTCIISSFVVNDGTQYTVVGIGDIAFSSCWSLTYIQLPPTIRYIGYGAFYDCRCLQKIILPDSLEQISGCAFAACWKLEYPIIPENTKVDKSAFNFIKNKF